MAAHLPGGLAEYWSDTVSLPELGSRTVEEAIAAGLDFKDIWRAVWAALELDQRYL